MDNTNESAGGHGQGMSQDSSNHGLSERVYGCVVHTVGPFEVQASSEGAGHGLELGVMVTGDSEVLRLAAVASTGGTCSKV
jgi:hypothetical protein